MHAARRAYLYLLAFAGLVTSLYAAAGMLALTATTLTQQAGTLLAAGDVRSRASLYLAELVVGLPVWLLHWRLAEGRAARAVEERQAAERRLCSAAVYALTALVALVALRELLQFVLLLPAARPPAAIPALAAGARLLVFGAAWLGFLRYERAAAGMRATDAAAPAAEGRPLPGSEASYAPAIYLLAAVALGFLVAGAYLAARQIVRQLLPSGEPLLLAPATDLWGTWGPIASWLLAGAPAWAAAWRRILATDRTSPLYRPYLDLVLLLAVPAALAAGIDLANELLRRLFGYRDPADGWDFLATALPALLVAGAAWTYHWAELRRAPAADEPAPGGIPAPRRAPLALEALLGLAVAAPAFVSLLWLLLDFLLNSGATISGGGWWRDRLSFGLAAGLLGGALWLGAWGALQRAAAAAPSGARGMPERRRLLGSIVVASALFAVGFLIALLWLAFRALLGDALGPAGLSLALKELSAALVALALAATHGLLLRDDLRLGPAAPRLHVVALAAPGTEAAVAALRRSTGLPIELRGTLLDDGGAALALPELERALKAALGDTRSEQALLVVRPEGGMLLRYRR